MAIKDLKVEIPCPKCKRKLTPSFRDIERNPRQKCSGCGAVLEIGNAKAFTSAMDDVDAAFRKLKG